MRVNLDVSELEFGKNYIYKDKRKRISEREHELHRKKISFE